MSNKKIEKNAKSVKVRDLIKILKANENFLQSISYKNKELVLFLKEFRAILKTQENLDGEKFLEIFKMSLKDKNATKVSTLFSETYIESLPLDKLKDLISNESLRAKDLLFIAERRLGMPTGVLKKMKKDLIKQKILSTIENIEKLDAIQKKASE